MNKGRFFAVGVGAGDPLDITLRAVRTLENSEAVVFPVKNPGESSVAYDIALAGADISGKEKIEVVFPMKSVSDYREYLNDEKLHRIFEHLDRGHDVSVVTLGDVSVYSTAEYLRGYIEEKGYETHICAGISSFVAAAAKAKISLCENRESFSVVPAVSDKEELMKKLSDFDTLVIMKAGSALEWIVPVLKENGLYDKALMFCNVNMSDEYIGPVTTDRKGYFTTIIVKRGGNL